MSDAIETPEPSAPPSPASPRQVLLGLFILFQLAFLVVSNFLGFIKWGASEAEIPDKTRQLINRLAPGFAKEDGHGWNWSEQFETNIRRYTQLTGQDQAWCLFAPSVSKGTGFPCIILLWETPTFDGQLLPNAKLAFHEKNGIHVDVPWNPPSDQKPPPGVVLLLSDNEPEDVTGFLRIGKCRVRRYEGNIYLNLQGYEKDVAEDNKPRTWESEDEVGPRATRRVKRMVHDYHDVTLAYMKWRLKRWQDENPAQPEPKQVLLFQRYYRIHPPPRSNEPEEPRGWDHPVLWPIARWQPQGPFAKHSYQLEAFDFGDKRFVHGN